jgi:hypothetical protein
MQIPKKITPCPILDTNSEPFPESAKTNFDEFIDIVKRAHEEEYCNARRKSQSYRRM